MRSCLLQVGLGILLIAGAGSKAQEPTNEMPRKAGAVFIEPASVKLMDRGQVALAR